MQSPTTRTMVLLKPQLPSILASALSTQNHVDYLLSASPSKNFNNLPMCHHPAAAGFSPRPSTTHKCFLCSQSFSFVPCLWERGLWQRNQGEAQRHHRGKSQLRTPINTLKAHAVVNTLITQWNAAISISAHIGWELINDFTPIEQTPWTVRN